MIKYSDKFLPDRQVFLKEIKFIRKDTELNNSEVKVGMVDTIAVSTTEKSLDVEFKRQIKFDPVELFDLSVSYVIRHRLKEQEKMDWNIIDVEKLVNENKEKFLGDFMDSVSLLISQITASFGGRPLITPGRIGDMPENE